MIQRSIFGTWILMGAVVLLSLLVLGCPSAGAGGGSNGAGDSGAETGGDESAGDEYVIHLWTAGPMVNGPLKVEDGGVRDIGAGLSPVSDADIRGLGGVISRNHENVPTDPTVEGVVTLRIDKGNFPAGTVGTGFDRSVDLNLRLNVDWDSSIVESTNLFYTAADNPSLSGHPQLSFSWFGVGLDATIVRSSDPSPTGDLVWYDETLDAIVLDGSDPNRSEWWVDVLDQKQYTPDGAGLTDDDLTSVLAFRDDATGYDYPDELTAFEITGSVVVNLFTQLLLDIRMRNIEESTVNGNEYYALNDEDRFYDEIYDGNDMTPDQFSFEFSPRVSGNASTDPLVSVPNVTLRNPLTATDREYELFREWFGTTTGASSRDELEYRFNVHFREPMDLPNGVGPEAITILRGSFSAGVYGKLTATKVSYSAPEYFLELEPTDPDLLTIAYSAALDFTYDGELYNLRMVTDLGRLQDGVVGDPRFLLLNSRFMTPDNSMYWLF